MRCILGIKQRSAEMDRESKPRDDDIELQCKIYVKILHILTLIML